MSMTVKLRVKAHIFLNLFHRRKTLLAHYKFLFKEIKLHTRLLNQKKLR